MVDIHPTAVIDSGAVIGADVQIGPFCVIEANTHIGDRTRLESHVCIKSGTSLGEDNHVFDHAVLGGEPQHLNAPAEQGLLEIGSGNQFREYVTVHHALEKGHKTIIGNDNMLMVQSHIGHDSVIGNNTIITNNVLIGGHVLVEDRAYISGAVVVHQFCRVGRFAMVGGLARIVQDVAPYVTVDGRTSLVVGLNLIGLRRNGFDRHQIRKLKDAYRLLFRSDLPGGEAVAKARTEFPDGPAAHFHDFLSQSERGFVQARQKGRAATIEKPVKLRVHAEEETVEDNTDRKAG